MAFIFGNVFVFLVKYLFYDPMHDDGVTNLHFQVKSDVNICETLMAKFVLYLLLLNLPRL